MTPQSIPGPQPLRFWGWRGNNLRFIHDRVAYMQQLYQTYGSFAAFCTINPEQWYFGFGPSYNQIFLSQPECFAHLQPLPFPETSATARLMRGLLTLNGSEHQLHRSVLLPLFQRSTLPRFYERMISIIGQHLETWPLGTLIDLEQELKALTLNLFCGTILGLDVHAGLPSMLQTWFHMLTSASVLFTPKLRLPGMPYARLKALSYSLERDMHSLIQQKQTQAPTDTHDALRILLDLQQTSQLTPSELVGECITLLLAGHETTANALTWILFVLSQAPGILKQVRTELETSIQNEFPTLEELESLVFLDCVIRETLRLLPPVTYQHRQLTEPTTIAGYDLPQGAIVTYSPFITHRIEQIYPNPLHFNPDRWITIKPELFAYLPFGAGPRMCLGMSFALLEIKLVLSMILRRFSLHLPAMAVIDYRSGLTLGPRRGMPMQVCAPLAVKHTQRCRGTIWKLLYLEDDQAR